MKNYDIVLFKKTVKGAKHTLKFEKEDDDVKITMGDTICMVDRLPMCDIEYLRDWFTTLINES